jgi:hypothetical protein
MKKSNIILFLMLISIISCKKNDDKLSLNEIVQTDENGNVINEGNNNDWDLIDFQNIKAFTSLNRGLTVYHESSYGDSIYIKKDCVINYGDLIITMFPNPVPQLQPPTIRIESTIPIMDVAYSYRRIGENFGGTNAGISSTNYSNNRKFVEFYLSGVGTERDDLEIYLGILTNDTCVYYSSGKIKFE